MEISEVIYKDSSEQIINILTIAVVTMTALWVLLFLKNRKLKDKIKRLEDK